MKYRIASQAWAIAKALELCRRHGHAYVYERGYEDYIATIIRRHDFREVVFYRLGADED